MTSAAPTPVDSDSLADDAHVPDEAWANDDILFTKPARMALGARYPQGLRVLDWPELRALFAKHEAPASRNRRRDRRSGLISVLLAGLGLVAAAFAPVAAGAERWMGLAILAFTLVGTALAVFHLLGAQSRIRWLGNRYWTERARGFYFQTIVNNLGLVARAMREDAALAEWKAVRAQALRSLHSPDDLAGQIRKLAGHIDENGTWIIPDWEKPPETPQPSKELDLLLNLLRSQRFDIQLAYSDGKLGASLTAPKRRSETVQRGIQYLPPLAVTMAAVAGALLAAGLPVTDPMVRLALAAAAGAAAVGLALRVLEDGLLLAGDATRYAWYSTAVRQVRGHFDSGGLPEKVAALREMETVAYRDLQEFVAAHWRARYVL